MAHGHKDVEGKGSNGMGRAGSDMKGKISTLRDEGINNRMMDFIWAVFIDLV